VKIAIITNFSGSEPIIDGKKDPTRNTKSAHIIQGDVRVTVALLPPCMLSENLLR
jgi:hypothetical protein